MSKRSKHQQLEQDLPREESTPEVQSLRSVGRLTRRRVGGRVSGPGDRAPKPPSSREPTPSACADGQGVSPISVDVAVTLPTGSKEFGKLRESPAREPGDLDEASPSVVDGKQAREGESRNPSQFVEESDAVVVPRKSAKTRVTPVESMEGRAAAKGKSAARNASPTQSGQGAPTSLQRIGKRAKQKPKEQWTNLLSHIRVPLLKERTNACARRRPLG